MHELYDLERVTLEAYASHNFPKGNYNTSTLAFFRQVEIRLYQSFLVMNTLTNFANITLSSLYFDITKDCLYANGMNSLERRAVVTVLEKVRSNSVGRLHSVAKLRIRS